MTAVWVVGENGLLGAALLRALSRRGFSAFTLAERFRWDTERELAIQLASAVNEFAGFVGAGNPWQIYWAAGVGTMSSTAAELATETRTLSRILSLIESEPGLTAAEGCFAFASSAGAIYAGVTDDIVSESTAVAPTTDYAREKLQQEGLVETFARQNGKVTALIARISTLYGPGQASGKQQGLMAHIARCILRNQPVTIYVPFDTIRDYIAADDAAALVVATLHTIDRRSGVFTKIIASERPTTIAEIISIFRRVSRRRPRIVSSSSRLSSIYSRRIRFHSTTLPVDERMTRTSLLTGIAQVMAAERLAYTRPYRIR